MSTSISSKSSALTTISSRQNITKTSKTKQNGQLSSQRSFTTNGLQRSTPSSESKRSTQNSRSSQRIYSRRGSFSGSQHDRRKRPVFPRDGKQSADTRESDQKEPKEDLSGVIPRVLQQIFEEVGNSDNEMEYTIRVSFVEIFLEQIRDLLNPSNRFLKLRENKRDGTGNLNDVLGLSSICCVTVTGAKSLLYRGNAFRIASDSTQSHSIFRVQIQQKEMNSDRYTESHIDLVEIAGSRSELSTPTSDVSQHELKVRNRSYLALSRLLRCLSNMSESDQNKEEQASEMKALYEGSKLTKLLRNALGGDCCTVFLFTVSPASFNISASLATIKLGEFCKKIRNRIPKKNIYIPHLEGESMKHDENKSENKLLKYSDCLQELKGLQRELESERSMEDSDNAADNLLLTRLSDFLKKFEDLTSHDELSSHQEDKNNDVDELASIQIKLDEQKRSFEALQREKITVLKTSKQNAVDLLDAQTNIQKLNHQMIEQGHRLKLNQFREYEAVQFTRLFRRFYGKLYNNKLMQGSGDFKGILSQVDGGPDLTDLVTIDKFLVESGLMEETEVGKDDIEIETYEPSSKAILRSKEESKKHREKNVTQESNIESKTSVNFKSHEDEGISDSKRNEHFSELGHDNLQSKDGGKSTFSPSERFNSIHYARLEDDLLNITKKYIGLKVIIDEEKSISEALQKKQSSSKERRARQQEIVTLRREREQAAYDLQAVVWKMNELNMINKAYGEKISNKEHQMTYLEDSLLAIQQENARLISIHHQKEKKFRTEVARLQSILDDATKPLWQFGDSRSIRNVEQRMILPVKSRSQVQEKRDDDEEFEGNSIRHRHGNAFTVNENGNELRIMMQHGKSNDYISRRFTRKIGSSIKPAVLAGNRLDSRRNRKIMVK